MSPLAIYGEEVKLSQRRFILDLQELPEPLNQVVTQHYLDRISRANGKPLLGEYAPWLLSDLLAIKDRKVTTAVARPWFYLYAYTLFIDDLIDFKSVDKEPSLLISSGVVLEQGLSRLYELFPQSQQLSRWIGGCSIQAALSAINELGRHKWKIQPFTEDELANLGDKISTLRLCAACLLMADRASGVSEEDLRPIGPLGGGMQLLDDISDWEEDWRVGNLTYPLSLAISRLIKTDIKRAMNPRELTAPEILTAMVLTGSLERCLEVSSSFLYQVIELTNTAPRTPGLQFLQSLLEKNVWLSEHTKQAREICEEGKELCGEEDWLQELVNNQRVHQRIHLIGRHISIVAQQS